MADAPAPGHGIEHVLSRLAQRAEGEMEVERRDVAGVAVLVVFEGIGAVGETIINIFRRLEGNVRDLGLVVAGIVRDQPRGTPSLGKTVSMEASLCKACPRTPCCPKLPMVMMKSTMTTTPSRIYVALLRFSGVRLDDMPPLAG